MQYLQQPSQPAWGDKGKWWRTRLFGQQALFSGKPLFEVIRVRTRGLGFDPFLSK